MLGRPAIRKLSSSPRDLLGDGVAGEESDAEAFAGGALDRLARVELPNTRRLHARGGERVLGDRRLLDVRSRTSSVSFASARARTLP